MVNCTYQTFDSSYNPQPYVVFLNANFTHSNADTALAANKLATAFNSMVNITAVMEADAANSACIASRVAVTQARMAAGVGYMNGALNLVEDMASGAVPTLADLAARISSLQSAAPGQEESPTCTLVDPRDLTIASSNVNATEVAEAAAFLRVAMPERIAAYDAHLEAARASDTACAGEKSAVATAAINANLLGILLMVFKPTEPEAPTAPEGDTESNATLPEETTPPTNGTESNSTVPEETTPPVNETESNSTVAGDTTPPATEV